MKKRICLLLLLIIILVAFTGCGTTKMHSQLYADAVASFKENTALQFQVSQKVTTVISGGSFVTASNADVKVVNLQTAPVSLVEGTITAIGANVNYQIYHENGIGYLNLYGEKTKTECDLAKLLQENVGLSVDSIDLNMLLGFSEEELSKAVLQTKDNLHYFSVELPAETFGKLFMDVEGESAPVVITYIIDFNRYLNAIIVETGMDATYAGQEANITFKLEFTFKQPEEAITITPPEDLDSYSLSVHEGEGQP